MMDRLATLALALVLAAPAQAADPPPEVLELTVLHINDVYEISPQKGWGGMAPLMTLLEEERARARHHLTTHGGDLLSPSILSSVTQGEQMIALTNAIGVNVAVLGNHEFDFGLPVLTQRVAESRYKWLGSNVLGPDGKPIAGAVEHCVLRFGTFKVGLFGVLTPETKELTSLDPGIRITEVIPVAREWTRTLRELHQVDMVLVLTHLTMAEDLALARAVPGIDVMLGGHDHDARTFHDGRTFIHKSGHDGHYLGVIDLRIERTPEEVTIIPAWRMRPVRGVAPHPGVAAEVARYDSKLESELARPVGHLAADLDAREAVVRNRESPAGNLVADAMVSLTGAEAALFNGGGLRADTIYKGGSTLTRGDVVRLLPFQDVVVVLALTGQQLLDALEHGVSRIGDSAGRFPQVSGLRFAVDPKAPPGHRVQDLLVGGQPSEPDRTYRIAAGSFMASGGDGYSVLATARRLVDHTGGALLTTAVIDYLLPRTPFKPTIDGRITLR